MNAPECYVIRTLSVLLDYDNGISRPTKDISTMAEKLLGA